MLLSVLFSDISTESSTAPFGKLWFIQSVRWLEIIFEKQNRIYTLITRGPISPEYCLSYKPHVRLWYLLQH